MTPIRQDYEPRPSRKNRREDFPPRGYVENAAFPRPDAKAFDRSPLFGWLAISGLTAALGIVGYFVLFGPPGQSDQAKGGFTAGGETLVLPQAGPPAAPSSTERRESSLRPKSITSGAGPVEAPTQASSPQASSPSASSPSASSPGEASAARAQVAVATPQSVVASTPETLVPPAQTAPRLTATPGELAHLLGRADTAIARGDVAVARDFYETAYDSGSAEAATFLARTYDPLFLQEIAALGVQPDPEVAAAWYRRGEARGDPLARPHLDALLQWLQSRDRGGN